jgi:MoaA/NifB/PqqE/SkfB family radical SAM enzyme
MSCKGVEATLSLSNKDINEESIFNFIKEAPKLFVYLTTRCNFNCLYCYLGNRLKQKLDFSLSDVINIINIFAELEGEKNITFLGGEPLLYRELGTLLKYAKEKRYYVQLDTNGFYSIRDALEGELDYIDEVSISLDGASPSIHDKLRVKGSFNRAIENIVYLKKKDKKIRATTTVTKLNLLEMPQIIELIRKLDIDYLNLHLLSLNGYARYHPELWVTPEEWFSLIFKIWNSDLRIRFPLAYLPENLVINEENSLKSLLNCECEKLSRLSLFPDGKVYCCSLLFDTDLNVGIYDFNKKTILVRPGSELYLIRTQKSCIAKDFIVQQDGFINICRFKKIENNDKLYGDIIRKIREFMINRIDINSSVNY